MKFALLLFIFFSGCGMQPAFAQVIAPTVPIITDAQKLVYFKAQSQFQSAQLQAQQAAAEAQTKQASLQAAVKAITDTCGKDFTAGMDAKGDPVCLVKDAPVKK